jgi:sodium/hydrogen antiporter
VVLVAVFGAALLVAVLLSGLAAGSVLSTSLLFLVGGAVVSDGFLGLIHITPHSELVEITADLALFAVLFTDGMHVSFGALRQAWRHPARALGLGMPLAILVIRPASLLISLIGTPFDRRERLTGAWFGPKGFASVVYGLLVLQAGIPEGEEAFTLIAVCIAFSIVAHSSTDVPIARIFATEDSGAGDTATGPRVPQPAGPAPGKESDHAST